MKGFGRVVASLDLHTLSLSLYIYIYIVHIHADMYIIIKYQYVPHEAVAELSKIGNL